MFTSDIKELAGLPVSFTEPECVERCFFVDGYDQNTYALHSRTVAHWSIQIGDHKEEIEISHDTNSPINKPFISLAEIVGRDPITLLGNRILSHGNSSSELLMANLVYFDMMVQGLHKSISSVIGSEFTTAEIMAIGGLLLDVRKYFMTTMVETDKSDLMVLVEPDLSADNVKPVAKRLEDLGHHEIIWGVVGSSVIKRHPERKDNHENPYIREQILLDHRHAIAHNLFAAEEGCIRMQKEYESAVSNRDKKQAEIDSGARIVPSRDFLIESMPRYEAKIAEWKERLDGYQARREYAAQMLAMNNRAARKTQ